MRRNGAEVQRFIEEVRSWIGTPFMHAGRVKGVGADCVGILIESARALGLLGDYQNVNYSTTVDTAYLLAEMCKFCRLVPPRERKPGDILLFSVKGNAQHTGVLVSENTFVHAYQSAGKVVESELEPVFARSLVAVFRVKEQLWQR